MSILQSPRETCILRYVVSLKIEGVTLGIIKMGNATKRGVFQEHHRCPSCKALGEFALC